MDKVAIVTAASRGMGAASAKKLCEDGFKVSLLARSEEVMQLGDELGGFAMMGSVASDSDLQSLVDATIKNFGRVDVVVNNTGHSAKGELLEITDKEWLEGYELLFLNVVRMSRIITPVFQKQGGGCIINISSFAALEPSLDFPVSSSVRAGLASYTKLYASKYAEKGIRMNSILPGFIDSYPVSGELLEAIPASRSGKVQEVAELVSFLASESSQYINGENIKIDGGLSRSM